MFTREKLIRLVDDGAPLARIFRDAAADVFNEALVIEAKRFIDERQELLDDGTTRLALKGSGEEREALFPFGPLPVETPRVFDKRPGSEPITFTSRMLPRYLKEVV